MHIMLWQDWASSNEDLSLLEWKRHSELPPGARPPLHPGCFSGCLFWGIHRQTITWEGCCSSHDFGIYINLCWTVAQQCLFPVSLGERSAAVGGTNSSSSGRILPIATETCEAWLGVNASWRANKYQKMWCNASLTRTPWLVAASVTRHFRAKALQSHHSFEVSAHSQPAPWLGKQDSWQTLWLGFSRLAINLCQTSGVDSSLTLLCIIRP